MKSEMWTVKIFYIKIFPLSLKAAAAALTCAGVTVVPFGKQAADWSVNSDVNEQMLFLVLFGVGGGTSPFL